MKKIKIFRTSEEHETNPEMALENMVNTFLEENNADIIECRYYIHWQKHAYPPFCKMTLILIYCNGQKKETTEASSEWVDIPEKEIPGDEGFEIKRRP